MDTRLLFTLLILAVAAQRLWEVRLSKRHEAALLARGGREHGAGHFSIMRALHTLWFVAMLAEVWLLDRPFVPWLAGAAMVLVVVGQALRYAAIRTLGERWTVRIITVPDAPPVSGGLFRRIRHPNYLGVVLEIVALPLVHGAYLTALVFTIANALLLRVRIQAEERALDEANRYDDVFGDRPRFIPHV